MTLANRPERDARRVDEARQLRDDRAAQNPSWVAWLNLRDNMVYGSAIAAAQWRQNNSVLSSAPWRHPTDEE